MWLIRFYWGGGVLGFLSLQLRDWASHCITKDKLNQNKPPSANSLGPTLKAWCCGVSRVWGLSSAGFAFPGSVYRTDFSFRGLIHSTDFSVERSFFRLGFGDLGVT